MAKNKLRPAKRTDDTPFDRILASFVSEAAESQLTNHEEEVRERYIAVAAISDEGYPDSEVIAIYLNRFPHLSRATAYRDLRAAQELFGKISQTSRAAKRHAVIQLAKRGLQMAEKYEDPKAFAAQIRNLILLEGLDKDDTVSVDPEQIQPPTFILQLPAGNATVKLDLSNISNVLDVEHEVIMDGVESNDISPERMSDLLDEAEQDRK
jgi:hypothetical protein